jgi:hypothetical protein
MRLSAEETRLKTLLKAAVVEVLEERRDLVQDALEKLWRTSVWRMQSKLAPDPRESTGQKFSRSCARVGEVRIQEQLRQRPEGHQDDYWRYEGLEGFRFGVARKQDTDEAEFIGLCLLVGDQTWMPFHLRLRIAPKDDHIVSLECKVGELGMDNSLMIGTSYGSSRETKLLYSVVNRFESIRWAYTIKRGAASDAA